MVDLRVTTLTGRETMLPEAAVAAFQESLRGQLIAPGDERYDEARQVWNANIDRRPGLICRPAGVADVITAVTFARDHQLLVSVRGGAHSFAGTCVCNGGLVIDLSLMKGIRVDPVRRTVRAEGGVKWGEFDRETQAFGLATTGGTVADTGIAGLTLGGGHGWLGNRYRLVSDNLTSVDIVTADGQCRIASDTEQPDLFWGVRGGGGNFGVVTSFEYHLYPVGMLLAGLVFHPFERAKDILQFYRDFSRSPHEEVTTYAALLILVDYFDKVPSPLSVPFFQQTGGAMQRGITAYGHRDALYNLILIAQWLEPNESARHVHWTRELWQALRPYATGGVYVNDIGQEFEDGADLVRAAYGVNYQRLAELKQKYDPTNLFRHNQNIKPAV